MLTRLPKYLIMHVKRFTKNNFFMEKNPTIVNFPVKNLELKDVIPVPNGPDGNPVPSKVPPKSIFKPQLQILTLGRAPSRDIEDLSRPIVMSSTACRRDAEIGIAIYPICSVSPLKRGPNDIAIFPSRDWSV